MRYMLLIYKDEQWWDGLSETEQTALVQRAFDYSEQLRPRGFYRGGERLQATTTATTVRFRSPRTAKAFASPSA